MRRRVSEHFGREIRPILSSLLQQNYPPLPVIPEVLDQICDTATTQALQRVASGSGTEITPRQSYPSAIPNRHLEEAHPANPQVQGHFGAYNHQPRLGTVGDQGILPQHGPPSNSYPSFAQPGGSMGPNPYYGNLSSMGSNIPVIYQHSLPVQPDVRGVPGAAFDHALAEFAGPSAQNTFPVWNQPY